ncbi:AAA domain containing protein [uncultured Caudovirales phage]|uniref:AAA domain containing protein n=1 Tax=uncultured Caudovirales phage TaxID=2100421 RepID=A0A6J5KMQ1_9CAUD|nr:AAA domain containing protein [uncultured Caudovirales phage]
MVEKVKPVVMAKCVRTCYEARKPLFIWGPPGTAKSAVVKATADEMGLDFIDLRLVQIDALDLRGMPKVRQDPDGVERMHFVLTSLLPKSGKGILFLDEFVQAPTLVMNAASELVLDRRVGEYRLPDGWSIVAAGNRRTDRSGTTEIPRHIANRFIHIEAQIDAPGWLEWGAANNIHSGVLGYIRSAGADRLYKFSGDELAFPTLRSWEFVSDILHTGVTGAALRALVIGAVGGGVGSEIITWIESNVEVATYADVVANPDTVPIPTRQATKMMFVDAVMREALVRDWSKLREFFDRFGAGEMRVYIATQVATGKTAFSKNADVRKWAEAAILGS